MLTIPLFNSLMPAVTANLSQLKSFVSHLSTVKGDLSNITAPPFILAPYSAVEIPSHWAAHQSLFLEPSTESDSSRRVLLVLKNYLISLKGFTGHGTEYEAKKPLNPFLGEVFLGEWQQEGTKIAVEQVEHHPPVTACSIVNKEHGISSTGFVRQETSFSPPSGITVRQHGYALIRDDKHGETHLMTMPTMRIQGIALANPHVELEGEAYIASSSGYVTKISFDGSGTLGIKRKNRVVASVSKVGSTDPDKAIWKVLGQWTGNLAIKDEQGTLAEEFSTQNNTPSQLRVASVEEQGPRESRRAWRSVFDGIRSGDLSQVDKHKTQMEESQRRLRAREEEEGTRWESKLFVRQGGEDKEARRLMDMIPSESRKRFDVTMSGGFWKFRGMEDGERVVTEWRQRRSSEKQAE